MSERMNYDGMVLLAMEALDGIEYKELKAVLRVLIPGIKFKVIDDDDVDVTIPEGT